MFSSHSWWSSIWQVKKIHMIRISCQILDHVSFLHNISYSGCLLWTCCPEIETRFVSMSEGLCFLCCNSTTHPSNVKVFIALSLFVFQGLKCILGQSWTERCPKRALKLQSLAWQSDAICTTCSHSLHTTTHAWTCVCKGFHWFSDVNNLTSLSNGEPTIE